MKVVVLAGGEGRRLRPLTQDTPKVLLPVCGQPLLWYMEEWLQKAGVEQTELTAGIAADTLREFAADTARRVRFHVQEEATPLGEAGCLARFGGEELLVLAGDTLPVFSLEELLRAHHQHHAAATVAVCTGEAGTIAVMADGAVRETRAPAGFSPWRYGGAVLLSAEATARLSESERVDLPEFLERLIRAEMPVRAFPIDPVIDVNTPQDYRQAVKWAQSGKTAPYIGQNVRCGEGAIIDAYTAVEDGAQIGAGVELCGCIVGAGAVIGDGVRARECVIDAGGEIGQNVRIERDGVIGRGARVADGVTLSAGVRVWSGMSVAGERLRPAPLRWQEEPAVLTQTSPREWTAARLAALGAALGSEWGGVPVLVCVGGHTAAVLRRALIAGLCETGCAVQDGGESFLAEAAYLTATLPVKQGVFFGEEGLFLLDESGCCLPNSVWQTVQQRLSPEDVRRREPYEWQLPRDVAAVRGLYRDWLLRQAADIRPVPLTLCGDRAATERLWEVLACVGFTRGDALRLRLSDGGRRLAVHTPETGYLDADRVEELLAWVGEKKPSRRDGLAAALYLLQVLTKTGESLAALNARLPAAVTVYRTAEITPKTAAALRDLPKDALDSEGVRVAHSNGVVTVRPAAQGRLLSVLARAERAEIAEELCAGMIEQLCAIPLDN